MRTLRQLPSFTNVAANSTATLDLPLGLTYEKIVIVQGGTLLRANMTNITLEANGKPIQFYKTAERLQAINRYYKRYDVTTTFNTIWLNRNEFIAQRDRRACGLGTEDLQTLQLKIDITTATSPTLVAYAVLGPQQPMGLICKVKEFSYSAAAGQWEIDNIPKGPRILALHFFKSDLTALDIELDSRRVIQATKALLDQLAYEAGREPQSGYAHVDFAQDGDLMQAMMTAGVRDFRLRPTTTGAAACPVTVEYLDGFAGI